MESAKGELVPGGLAMVYGLVYDTDLNWRIVTLKGRIEELWPEHRWHESHERGDWAVEGELFIFHARNLMPINPEADPPETTQEQEKCMIA